MRVAVSVPTRVFFIYYIFSRFRFFNHKYCNAGQQLIKPVIYTYFCLSASKNYNARVVIAISVVKTFLFNIFIVNFAFSIVMYQRQQLQVYWADYRYLFLLFRLEKLQRRYSSYKYVRPVVYIRFCLSSNKNCNADVAVTSVSDRLHIFIFDFRLVRIIIQKQLCQQQGLFHLIYYQPFSLF